MLVGLWGKQTVRWKFPGSTSSTDTCAGGGEKACGGGKGWACATVTLLASADSVVSSEGGVTLLSGSCLCERTVSLYSQANQSLMQAAPRRGLAWETVAFPS